MTENDWLECDDPARMLRFLTEDDGFVGHAGIRMATVRQLHLVACAAAGPDTPDDFGPDACNDSAQWLRGWIAGAAGQPRELEDLADLLREVTGNPFRPASVCANITPTVTSLATAAYDERLPDGTLDPLRLLVLADAIEEAGCHDEACATCQGIGRLKLPAPYCDGYYLGKRKYVVRHCARCRGAGRVPHSALSHLRSPAPHVPGCWALDLVLGKT